MVLMIYPTKNTCSGLLRTKIQILKCVWQVDPPLIPTKQSACTILTTKRLQNGVSIHISLNHSTSNVYRRMRI